MLLPYDVEVAEETRGWATYGLIGVNTFIFLGGWLMGEAWQGAAYMRWGFVPDEWYRLHTMLTNQFLG